MRVDRDWLQARDGLHDARVQLVAEHAGDLVIHVDDEWANERGGGEVQLTPGWLTFRGFSVFEGGLTELENGWISELRVGETGAFEIAFCDRIRLVVRASEAFWTAR